MDETAQPIESPETKAMIKALLKEYPTLDQMQAETLVWGYQTNNLGVLQEQ